MKQQILLIHGGSTFNTYEEYINFLKTKEVTLEKLLRKDWKQNLQAAIGDKYLVVAPQMPNAQNARYPEWKIRFERIIPVLDKTIILIGHSLGAIFLAKYLSENDVSKNIKATFLVAAPYTETTGESLTDFKITSNLKNLERQAGKIFLYQSKDDPVVMYADYEIYQKELPNAEAKIFEDRQHFNQAELPEIIEDIQSLA